MCNVLSRLRVQPAPTTSLAISLHYYCALFSPLSLPSNFGLVATFRPGCGSRKQLMLEKQCWIWFLTFCNSSCWLCLTCIDTHSENVSLLLTLCFSRRDAPSITGKLLKLFVLQEAIIIVWTSGYGMVGFFCLEACNLRHFFPPFYFLNLRWNIILTCNLLSRNSLPPFIP